MKKVKAGFVGAGFVGPLHMENLRRLGYVEVAAVAEINQEQADKVASQLGIPRAYGDWRKLIDDSDIDVVHITAPNKMHYQVAKAALKAKKHVICEKPLTLDLNESKELVELAKEQKVINATTFNMAFYPMVRQAKAMVARGELGNIFLVHGRYLQDWLSKDSDYNWRVESKYSGKSRVVGDICSHWMHMAQMVSGKRIISVFADKTIFYPYRKKPTIDIPTHTDLELKEGQYENIKVDTEDHVSIMFNFEDNVKGILIAAQVCPGRKQLIELEINGSEKSLSWNGEEPGLLWTGNRSASNEVTLKDPNTLSGDARKYAHYSVGLAEGYPDTWKNLLMSIYEHVLNFDARPGVIPDYPTFEDGYRIQVLIDSVIESTEKKQWVDIIM